MTVANNEHTYTLMALTDLWTGSVTFKEKDGEIKVITDPNRLITTGLLGSIRWWFEVLVRGLGGSACDPSATKYDQQKRCVVCELFGCTGWARKFRFEVLDNNGKTKTEQIKKDDTFDLRFIPLRPIRNEEWALLELTFRLISKFGAIGGKTVFKPSDEKNRAHEPHHKDYGLVKVLTPQRATITRHDLNHYLLKWKKVDHGEFAWASLQHFWYVSGKYLTRKDSNESSYNKVLGRQEGKRQYKSPNSAQDEIRKWLAGFQQESKKIFSFKYPTRTFGFVKPGVIDFKAMEQRLKNVWREADWKFLTGDKIIEELFK